MACLQAPYGCGEVLDAGARRQHLGKCAYYVVTCAICKKEVLRRDTQAHYHSHSLRGQSCGLVRPLACPLRVDGCDFESHSPDEVRRHIPQCSLWHTLCLACGAPLLRSQIPDHQAHTCTGTRSLAPFFAPFLDSRDAVAASTAAAVLRSRARISNIGSGPYEDVNPWWSEY